MSETGQKSATMLDEVLFLRAELTRLQQSNAALVESEHKLSDAYVRLRAMIPGAFDTPHAPTGEQIWKITEAALSAMKDRSTRTETALANLFAMVQGECPSLLRDHHLFDEITCLNIETALAQSAERT